MRTMPFRPKSLLATAALSLLIVNTETLIVRAEPSPYGSAGVATAAPSPGAEPGDELPARLRRQLVDFPNTYAAGTIVIDTAHTFLYLVLGGGKALRYGIGVGREGFTWSGVQTISRMAEWPDWSPPAEMIRRQPYLPRFVAGGPGNPLGARALYLGQSEYRIHGTNDASTIGRRVSSGCIRMTNEDVSDLYGRVRLGAAVVVLPASPTREAAATRGRKTLTIAGPGTIGSGGGMSGLY